MLIGGGDATIDQGRCGSATQAEVHLGRGDNQVTFTALYRGDTQTVRSRVYGFIYHGSIYHGSIYHGSTYHGSTYHGSTYYGPTYYDPTYYGSRKVVEVVDHTGSTYYGPTYYGPTYYGSRKVVEVVDHAVLEDVPAHREAAHRRAGGTGSRARRA
eukprot:scaffold24806_cov51-Phaeocystis_antarctica.AAC.2